MKMRQGSVWTQLAIGAAAVIATTPFVFSQQRPANNSNQNAASNANRANPQEVTLAPGDVNLEFSRVYAKVGKVGLGHEHGVIGKLKEGSFSLEKGQGKIVFDMTSFDADSKSARKYVGLEGDTAESTRKQVNTNMRGEEVLAVDKFPTATFEVTKIENANKNSPRGNPAITIHGDFTLHGVKRPITISADVENKDGWHHIRGSFSILQSEFGIKPYSKMMGAVGVADKLDIFGDLWIVP